MLFWMGRMNKIKLKLSPKWSDCLYIIILLYLMYFVCFYYMSKQKKSDNPAWMILLKFQGVPESKRVWSKHGVFLLFDVNRDGFPIQPSQTGFCKVYYLTPTLADNRDKRGLALDGKLKHEDTCLASSTMWVWIARLPPPPPPSSFNLPTWSQLGCTLL